MSMEERLFQAIGEVDEDLLKRSEQSAGIWRWVSWAVLGGLAACACLALSLLLAEKAPAAEPPASAQEPDPISEPVLLRLDGGDVGKFHLYQASVSEERGFVLYVNQESYRCREEDGVYLVEPLLALPSGLPPCRLEIVRRAYVSPQYAAEQAAAELRETYAEVSDIMDDSSIGGMTVSGGNGTAWDAAQADVYVVSDQQGGAYILTARYFTEATEGHGVRFRDMVGTFEAVTPGTSGPAWLKSLRETANHLIPAVFAGDLEPVRNLLTEDAVISGTVEYPEDITVSSIDYTTDDDDSPTSAVVSVRYRSGTEDSYDYLTLELERTEGRWLASFAGIEK